MTVRIESTVCAMLDPIDVHVLYVNNDAGVWTLNRPDKSVAVSIHAVPADDDPIPGHHGHIGFMFGQFNQSSVVLENGDRIATDSMPEQPEITIAPRGTYESTVAISQGRAEEFTAGPRIIHVKDDKKQLKSNVLRHTIVLTRSSVDRLLQRVKDKSLPQPERNSAADWLEYINPEPRLQMRFGTLPADEVRRSRKEVEWPALLRECDGFWRKERNPPAMRKTLEEVNGWNGVPADVYRAMEERDDQAAEEEVRKQSSRSDAPSDPAAVPRAASTGASR